MVTIPKTALEKWHSLAERVRSLPFLLYSYIANEMLAPFFASFLILYSIFFLVRLVPLLDVVLDLKIGFADFIRMFSYIFPHMLVYVIPMASMIGVTLAFTRLTSDREILALKASGVSIRNLLPPVIAVALAISLLTALFSIKLIPAGNVSMKRLFFQLAKEKIDKGLQERTFTETLGDLVVYVDRIHENEQWEGVYISDMRNRKQPVIIMARRGQLTADIDKMQVTIVLGDGTIHNTDGTDNQIIRFLRYQLNIPLKSPTNVHGENVTTLDRGSMTLSELRNMARQAGTDTRGGIVFLTEFYWRLVLPVSCFVLTLLGLPLGLQAVPGRRSIGIPLGIGFFVFYYIMSTVGTILSEDSVVPVLIGMWLPCLLLAGITVFIFIRVEKEKPIISNRIQNRINDLVESYVMPLLRKARRWASILLHLRFVRKKSAAPERSASEIHANAQERVYHRPGCVFYDCSDCTLRFRNARLAEKAGFTPCDLCYLPPEIDQP